MLIEPKTEHMDVSNNLDATPGKTVINGLQQLLTNPQTTDVLDIFKNLLAVAAVNQDVSTVLTTTSNLTTNTVATPTAAASSAAATSIESPAMPVMTTKPVPLMSTQPKPLMQNEIQPLNKLQDNASSQPPNLMGLELPTSISSSVYSSYLPPIRPRDRHEQEDSLLIIDGRSYRIRPDQKCLTKIYFNNHELYCDTRTKDVYIDSKRVYRMGVDSTKEIPLNGRRVRVMYMGKRVELWINGVSYHFRADAPPKQITVTSPLTGFSKRYHVTIDGRTMDMSFNYFRVCNLNAGLQNRELVQTVKLAADDYETHEIAYMCPPKRIMIDEQPRIMRYDLPIPCVEIDGFFYVIRFSGPPHSIMIDNVAYEVPFDRVIRIHLSNRAHELAWGGPGFEVIIDGRPYELQFGQSQPREVFIGTRQHYIKVLGDAPDVKICGRVPDHILREHEEEIRMNDKVEQQPAPSGALNVNELFKKLVQANILPSHKKEAIDHPSTNTPKPLMDGPPQFPEEQIPDLTSLDVNLLKQKYNQAIQNLYGGTQCATCGMRFTSEQAKRFSNHYDWHFRQNKREKEEINKAHTRNWYYDVTEWIQYEELSEEDQVQQSHLQVDGDPRTSSATTSDISYLSSNPANSNNNNNEDNDHNNTSILHNSTLKTSICAATNDIDDVRRFFYLFISFFIFNLFQ